MTNLPPVQLSEALITWLRKRGEPDSGIDYRASNSWQDAVVRLHGTDADFVASHFHGQGARDLADALLTELQHSRAEEAVAPEGMSAVLDALTEIGRHIDSSRGIGADAFYAIRGEIEKARAACLSASPVSPSATGVRVTEAMLDKALIAQHENDPDWKKRYDATAIRLRTEDMTRALVAAIAGQP